jgi:hypothetical protein
MIKNIYLMLPIAVLCALSACSIAPKGDTNTFASRLMVQGGQAQAIAKKWDLGQHIVNKGENMKTKGQKHIIDDQAMIAKGQKMIQDGTTLIADGTREMADAESSYETLRANPVPLSTPITPTTP